MSRPLFITTPRWAPLVCALLVAAAPGAHAREARELQSLPGQLESPPPETSDAAFFELAVEGASPHVGQSISLRLVFGIDRELEEDNLVQLFQRRLDLPVQIAAPWLGALECTTSWSAPEPLATAPSASFVLNGELARCIESTPRTIGAKTYRVFVYERSFVPICAGPLVLPEASLRFATATEFRADLFGRSAPEDRRDQRALASSLQLDVAPLPEADRPIEFIDAIGRFEVSAELDRYTLEQGQRLRLRVAISGAGNLDSLTSPRLDWSGFHLLGVERTLRASELVLSYEFTAERPGEFRLPGWQLPTFDPKLSSYRTLATDGFRVVVRPTVNAQARESSASLPIALRTRPPASPLWPIAVAALVLLFLLIAPGRARTNDAT